MLVIWGGTPLVRHGSARDNGHWWRKVVKRRCVGGKSLATFLSLTTFLPSPLILPNHVLIAGDYSPNFCRGMIHKQEKRQFQHSHIDPDSVYPSDVALVRRMEGPMCHQDALSEYYNVDALWDLRLEPRMIFGNAWRVVDRGVHYRDAILHRLMMMGRTSG